MTEGKPAGQITAGPQLAPQTTDVSSLKTAAEELFSRFFMSSPVGLHLVQNGKFMIVNPKFQEYIGYSEAELIGQDSLSFVVPEHREQVRECAISMLKGERTTPYEFMVLTRGGETRWIMETVTPIEFLGRRAALGNFMDITARKSAEEALSQSEQLYRAVIQQAAETICIVEVESRLIFETNPAFRSLLNYTEDELRTMTLYDFIQDQPSGIDRNIAKIVNHGEHFLGERFWRKKDGSLVEMEVSANAIFYAGRQALCVVARTIVERKQAERERKFLTQRLMSVGEEERKRLARDLHDELGQMLTALRFVLDALDKSLDGELDWQRKKCREAMSLVEHIGSFVRTLLFELRPSLLDDLGLVPTLQWYIARFMSHHHGIKIEFDPLGIKRRFRRENEEVLFRVFQECLNNVVRHSQADNVKVSLTYSYPKIIFVFADDGIGFNKDSRTFRTGHGGQGIGLLGMRERVDSVGGSFEVNSNLGVGTSIRVEIEDTGEETSE